MSNHPTNDGRSWMSHLASAHASPPMGLAIGVPAIGAPDSLSPDVSPGRAVWCGDERMGGGDPERGLAHGIEPFAVPGGAFGRQPGVSGGGLGGRAADLAALQDRVGSIAQHAYRNEKPSTGTVAAIRTMIATKHPNDVPRACRELGMR